MDSSPFDSGPQLDIGKLSESDKRELQQVIQGETQKAKIQECRSLHSHTSLLSLDLDRFLFVHCSRFTLLSHEFPEAKELIRTFLAVHNLTDICWKKCITGKISGSKLSSGEETCTQNCVERFLDSNMAVLKHLEAMKSSGGV